MEKKWIEVCFSPLLFDLIEDKEAIVVVVDILRATSAICTAFENGAEKLIPVETLDEAKAFKKEGYMVAAERDGYVKDFADFGNSPYNFTKERVEGQTIVYSTTNGTQTVQKARDFYRVAVGAFLNIEALEKWLVEEHRNVLILCAGWKGRFNLEDSLMAGDLAERLINTGGFYTDCDSAKAAIDLWGIARQDLHNYLEKVAQRKRLGEKGLDDVIPFCFTTGFTKSIPVYHDGYLLDIKKINGAISCEIGD